MMIAKEYIDRIGKLNLFYLSFYVKITTASGLILLLNQDLIETML